MGSSTAVFACSDLSETLAYYNDVLGFHTDWMWGDPPSFGSASLEGMTLFFNVQPELAKHVQGHEHWFSVEDVDKLHQKHAKAGAKIVRPLDDWPWGFREYAIEDINGYHLRFAAPTVADIPKSRPSPVGLKVERRKPTAEEFGEVASSVFGYKDLPGEVLEATWSGVVAKSADGDAIAVLRIMYDAPGWFSIWDVAVKPEWQAQNIGSTIMREALELIREASPGANVFLFTIKPGFYERFGFGEQKASFIRV